MIGYCRPLATEDREDVHRQRSLIRAEARRQDWSLTWIFDMTDSRDTLGRSGMRRALKLAANGTTDGIIVADLARLSGSLNEVAVAMDDSLCARWSIVSVEDGIDTDTAAGAVLARTLASYAKRGRSAEQPIEPEPLPADNYSENRLGEDGIIQRIIWERVQGSSLAKIANGLNRDSIAHPRSGDRWQPSMVWDVLMLTRPGPA
ncbi:MAG TPA: recombinase family protein [Solirubrobacterales bacterium]|jgi:hypothetical protein